MRFFLSAFWQYALGFWVKEPFADAPPGVFEEASRIVYGTTPG